MTPVEITIGHTEKERVVIRLTDSDATWLSGTAEIRSGIWSGTCYVSFFQDELGIFAKAVERLHTDLTGPAVLEPKDPFLVLTLWGDGRGHVGVRGVAPSYDPDNHLTFCFGIDQTELPAIIASLREADSMR